MIHAFFNCQILIVLWRFSAKVKICHSMLLGQFTIHPDIYPDQQRNGKSSNKACTEQQHGIRIVKNGGNQCDHIHGSQQDNTDDGDNLFSGSFLWRFIFVGTILFHKFLLFKIVQYAWSTSITLCSITFAEINSKTHSHKTPLRLSLLS